MSGPFRIAPTKLGEHSKFCTLGLRVEITPDQPRIRGQLMEEARLADPFRRRHARAEVNVDTSHSARSNLDRELHRDSAPPIPHLPPMREH